MCQYANQGSFIFICHSHLHNRMSSCLLQILIVQILTSEGHRIKTGSPLHGGKYGFFLPYIASHLESISK